MKICWKSFWIGFAIAFYLVGTYFGSKYSECIKLRQQPKVEEPTQPVYPHVIPEYKRNK